MAAKHTPGVDYDLPAELLVESDGPVRVVTLNRPDELNAANHAMHHGLTQLWDQLAADRDAGAVVVTGAGRAFSAGGDFAFMQRQHADAAFRAQVFEESRRLLQTMIAFPLPVIAAVNGPAVGLGCSLAVACDIVLIAERAFLADPHVTVGLVAGDGGAALWPLLTSMLRAKEYIFTGDRIPAATAVELGLANRVVVGDALMDEAMALARRLAALPRQALQDTKRALNGHIARAVAGIMDFALSAELLTMGSAEHQALVATRSSDR
jgi:enoyl-CoA hydratase